MSDTPNLLALRLERAQQCLKELVRPLSVSDITPAEADDRYTELRVVRQTNDSDGTVHLVVSAFIPRSAIQIAEVDVAEAPAEGIYALEMHLSESFVLSPGALGQTELAPGRYIYVGSGRKGLQSRLRRHASRDKNVRWHVDHLTTLSAPTRAVVWSWAHGRECLLAAAIATLGELVPGFGATDCRCRGHLVRLEGDDTNWWQRLPNLPPPLCIITPLSDMSLEPDL